MIAIGLPGHYGGDEDALDRERDDDGGDDDLATEAVMSILDDLKSRKASAVRDLRLYIDALAELCDAFVQRDFHRVGEAASGSSRPAARLNQQQMRGSCHINRKSQIGGNSAGRLKRRLE